VASRIAAFDSSLRVGPLREVLEPSVVVAIEVSWKGEEWS
jgi:hypothetical protein